MVMRIAGSPRRERFVVIVLIITAVLLSATGISALVRQTHESPNADPVAQCKADALDWYAHTTDPGKAGFGPRAYGFLVPRACALAARKGVLRSDGSIAGTDLDNLIVEAGNEFGTARVQKMMFTELAVSPYRLAPAAKLVTRWDRCVAMGYAGYDAQQEEIKKGLPARATFFATVRRACSIGIRRRLIPPSGAPSVPVLQMLMAEAALGARSG
jgi:hypothetical protein